MLALTFDRTLDDWAASRGMRVQQVDVPSLDGPRDRGSVLVKVRYAGFCGTDRGIWARKAMGDMVQGSMRAQGADRRFFGHELLGEIVEVGAKVTAKYGYAPGLSVSTESHIVCGACYQCRLGQYHVCANEDIIGVSVDGCFAEYVKLPAKALWPTDLTRIRPEVAAVQEPFGNAVHACQAAELRGRTVAVIGCGTIGLFAILIARGMGARRVIGVEVDPKRAEMARQLGCEVVLTPNLPPADRPWASDPTLIEQVHELTEGVGVDVVLEMAGFNSAMNNALKMARRGGHVVLFGVKNGDARVEDYHRVIMNGLQLHGVVGRQIFGTWEMTRALLENTSNGIQDAVWKVILNEGEGTRVHIDDWDAETFEQMIGQHPKVLIEFER